jgi:hypothetical protein
VPIPDLGGQDHRHLPLYPAEALQPVAPRRRRQGEFRDPAIEFIPPRELVLEQTQILNLVFSGQRRVRGRQLAQPVVWAVLQFVPSRKTKPRGAKNSRM